MGNKSSKRRKETRKAVLIQPRGLDGLNSLGFIISDNLRLTKQLKTSDGKHAGDVIIDETNFWVYVREGKHYNDVARCW
mgnify:CR=1 FL=1